MASPADPLFSGYCAEYPPSTMMSWPVVNAASGELSQRTAKAIFEQHHGRLFALSAGLNSGATFVVELPNAPAFPFASALSIPPLRFQCLESGRFRGSV